MQPYGYFPATYNPYQSQSYAQSVQVQQPPVQTNGGFIRVQNEQEARAYQMQPGTSLTFLDENSPFCYTKTLDFSQLDRPIFRKFELVEVTDTAQSAQNTPQGTSADKGIDLTAYALKADVDALRARIDALQKALDDTGRKDDAE